jgi:hypothetical protein
MRKIIVVLLMLSIGFSLSAQNVERKAGKGCRVNLQTEQLDIIIPYFLEDDLEIAAGFGVINAEKIGTDVGFGISVRKYLNASKVSPFFGIRGGALWYTPDDGDTTTDYIAGILGGAEYFFDEHLSIGVEYQVNFSFSDKYSYRFGNPDRTNFNSASAVSLSIYW